MIRVKALAVIRRPADGALLVFEGTDEAAGGYARPLGGSVEFGELAGDAVRREFMEEIGCELRDVRLITVLENRFVLDGEPGHEVVFLFSAHPADASLYEQESLPIRDVPGQRAVWWSPVTHSSRLVPEGLIEHVG